jgi:nucleoside-diphosphate-sugar epimerase
VESLGAEVVFGDLTDPGSLHAAAARCDAIFHTAAAIGTARNPEAFRIANVLGSEHVVAAAEAAGCRLVHVSSTAVFGHRRYGVLPTDESVPLPELPDHDAYGRSKQEAERVVLAAHAAGRISASVLRPPVMYGRRDRQFAPRLGPLLQRGVFPLVGGGTTTLSLVHADAVAEAAVRAATLDAAAGRVYHVTDDFAVTVAELVRYAALGLGRRVLAPGVSRGAARFAFKALAVALVMAGRPDLAPHATGVLDMFSRNNPFTSERARRELGWSPSIRPVDGIPDAFRWWSEHRRT